jgi:hypothetical protein
MTLRRAAVIFIGALAIVCTAAYIVWQSNDHSHLSPVTTLPSK